MLELIPKHYELQAVDYHLTSTQAKSDFARSLWNEDVWQLFQHILSHFGVYKVYVWELWVPEYCECNEASEAESVKFKCEHCEHQDNRSDNMKTHMKNNHSELVPK